MPTGDFVGRLALVDDDGQAAATWLRAPSETIPTSDWWPNEVVRGSYRLSLPLSVEPGSYMLVLELVDAASGASQGLDVTLGEVVVTPLSPRHESDVTFGEQIALLGHDVAAEDDGVSVTLYWRALMAPTNSYKVFLQAIDADSGEIVAQHDAIPCDWSCPTTLWEPGEVVIDHVHLAEPAAADATLVVGLYEETSLQRLIPAGQAALAQDGTAVVLAGVDPH